MAVGKEALIPSLCVTSAACRAALDESVSKFAEACAATPVTTIRRRIKDAKIEVDLAKATPASAANGKSPRAAKAKVEGLESTPIEVRE